MNRLLFISVVVAAWLLAGCESNPLRQADPHPVSPAAAKLPFEEPEAVAQELDEDLVFSYLVGEIGARQGDLRTSMMYYLHAAVLARDAYAAERATRIAIHLKDYEQGLRAARRWVELSPNSLTARQLTGVLLLRNGERDAALAQFQAAVKIADVQGKDGLLLAASTLSVETDHVAALDVTHRLVAEHAGEARAHYAMAVVETAQKRYTEAEGSLREAIRLRSDWSLPRILLSQVLVSLGRDTEGLALLAESVKEYPGDRVLRLAYSRLLVANHDYQRALAQFRQLYERDPEDHEVRYAYAMLATQQQAWDEARELWQLLRNNAKYYGEATYFLAQVEELAGNTQLAIGLYRSIHKGSFRVDAVIRSSALLAENGQLAEAREDLAQARVANPDRAEDLYIAETQVLQRAGADQAVILGVYQTAIGAHPTSNDLQYNRGLYYSDTGDYQLMEADFRAVLARDPDHAEALNALGYMLADQGVRLDEALTYVMRAHRLKPDNAAILDSLGWVYYRKGEFSNALRYLRLAVGTSVDDEIAAHFGEVLWVSGEQDEARSVWSEALKETPGSRHLRAVMERFLHSQ